MPVQPIPVTEQDFDEPQILQELEMRTKICRSHPISDGDREFVVNESVHLRSEGLVDEDATISSEPNVNDCRQERLSDLVNRAIDERESRQGPESSHKRFFGHAVLGSAVDDGAEEFGGQVVDRSCCASHGARRRKRGECGARQCSQWESESTLHDGE